MANPREQQHVGPVPEDTTEAEKPNPGGDPKDFLRLVKEAREATPEDQPKLVGELIDALVAMRAPGNERAEAKAVLGQLDLKALTGLMDPSGRSARAEAVQTVLTLGFPYALEVTPQDLEFARAQEERERSSNVSPAGLKGLDLARKAAVGLAGVSAALQGVVLVSQGFEHVDPTVLTAATATATAGWALWMGNRVGRLQRDLVQGATGIWLALGTFFTITYPGVSPWVGALAALPLVGAVSALAASRAARGDRPREP